jgi:hypothetical protein
MSETGIAAAAEQRAHEVGGVAMIDVEGSLGRPGAEQADATLALPIAS